MFPALPAKIPAVLYDEVAAAVGTEDGTCTGGGDTGTSSDCFLGGGSYDMFGCMTVPSGVTLYSWRAVPRVMPILGRLSPFGFGTIFTTGFSGFFSFGFG